VSRRSAQFARAAQWQRCELPLKGYFMWVGGALLVLLFAANWLLPTPAPIPLISSRVTLPPIRIYSATKAPDEVAAYDVSAATVGALTKSETAADASSSPETHSDELVLLQSPPPPRQAETHEHRRAATIRPALNTREAFAQFMPRQRETTLTVQEKTLLNRKKGKI
jgi:hypothetical protein